LLTKRSYSTKATILLFKELIEKVWPELSQCTLDIAPAQSTCCRSLLQHCLFTLSGQRLKGRALFLLCNISSLCFWPR
jgi:hypothetical protein